MSLIADGLMIAAALVSAIYCHVLAGRLRKLKELDGGVGQAIAALDRQALHAYLIGFTHPRTQERLRFEIELSNDINSLLLCLDNV